MALADASAFWVETDEPAHSRHTFRDAAKMLARQRQDSIANELSRLAHDEYLEDIMQHARHMEVCKSGFDLTRGQFLTRHRMRRALTPR